MEWPANPACRPPDHENNCCLKPQPNFLPLKLVTSAGEGFLGTNPPVTCSAVLATVATYAVNETWL